MATNLRFVKEFTFNQWGGATFFAIDECFTDAFDVYYVTLNKVDGNLNYPNYMRLLDSSGNIISDSEYAWVTTQMTHSGAYSELKSANTTNLNYVGYSGSGGTYDDRLDNGGSIYVFNPANASAYTNVIAQVASMNNSNVLYGYKTVGVHKSAEAVRGIGFGGHSAYYHAQIKVFGVA